MFMAGTLTDFVFLFCTIELFTKPTFITKEGSTVPSGSQMTMQCNTIVNKNNTKLMYIFKKSDGSFNSSQPENKTFVIGQISTDRIGNYSCVASHGAISKESDKIPIKGMTCLLYTSPSPRDS